MTDYSANTPARRVSSLMPGSPAPAQSTPVTAPDQPHVPAQPWQPPVSQHRPAVPAMPPVAVPDSSVPAVAVPAVAVPAVAVPAAAVPGGGCFSPAEQLLRRFRFAMNSAGLALTAVPILQMAAGAIFSMVLLLFFPYLLRDVGMNGVTILLTAIVYPLSFAVPLLILRLASKMKMKPLLSLRKPTRSVCFLAAPMLVLGLNVVGTLIDMAVTSLTSTFGVVSQDPTLQPASFSFPDLLVYFLLLAVMPALLEELVFRGALLTLLRPYGEGFAVLVTAVGFALIHGNLAQAPAAFLIGLVLGLVTVKSGSILPAMLTHFLNNGIAVATNLWYAFLAPETATLYTLIMYVIFLLLGLAGFLLLRRRVPDVLRLAAPGETAGCARFRKVLSCPGVLVFLAASLLTFAASFVSL